jgi:hypothetical protein
LCDMTVVDGKAISATIVGGRIAWASSDRD